MQDPVYNPKNFSSTQHQDFASPVISQTIHLHFDWNNAVKPSRRPLIQVKVFSGVTNCASRLQMLLDRKWSLELALSALSWDKPQLLTCICRLRQIMVRWYVLMWMNLTTASSLTLASVWPWMLLVIQRVNGSKFFKLYYLCFYFGENAFVMVQSS